MTSCLSCLSIKDIFNTLHVSKTWKAVKPKKIPRCFKLMFLRFGRSHRRPWQQDWLHRSSEWMEDPMRNPNFAYVDDNTALCTNLVNDEIICRVVLQLESCLDYDNRWLPAATGIANKVPLPLSVHENLTLAKIQASLIALKSIIRQSSEWDLFGRSKPNKLVFSWPNKFFRLFDFSCNFSVPDMSRKAASNCTDKVYAYVA